MINTRQKGSVSAEWVVVCVFFAIVLFLPFIDGQSPAAYIFESVQTALDNSATVVSLP